MRVVPVAAYLGSDAGFPFLLNRAADAAPFAAVGESGASPAGDGWCCAAAATPDWMTGIDTFATPEYVNAEPDQTPPRITRAEAAAVAGSTILFVILAVLLLTTTWFSDSTTTLVALYLAGAAVALFHVFHRGRPWLDFELMAGCVGLVSGAAFVVAGFAGPLIQRHFVTFGVTMAATASYVGCLAATYRPLTRDRVRVAFTRDELLARDPLTNQLYWYRRFGTLPDSTVRDELEFLPAARFVSLPKNLRAGAVQRLYAAVCGRTVIVFYRLRWEPGDYVLSGSVPNEVRRSGRIVDSCQADLNNIYTDVVTIKRRLLDAEVHPFALVGDDVHMHPPHVHPMITVATEAAATPAAGNLLVGHAYQVDVQTMRLVLEVAGLLATGEASVEVQEAYKAVHRERNRPVVGG